MSSSSIRTLALIIAALILIPILSIVFSIFGAIVGGIFSIFTGVFTGIFSIFTAVFGAFGSTITAILGSKFVMIILVVVAVAYLIRKN